jgi:hypothetical protein
MNNIQSLASDPDSLLAVAVGVLALKSLHHALCDPNYIDLRNKMAGGTLVVGDFLLTVLCRTALALLGISRY